MQPSEPAQQQEAGAGRTADQMTARNQAFEALGESVISALQSEAAPGGLIETGIFFATKEEASSFGKYFYRYIYLGREPVTLHMAGENGGFAICVSCEDPAGAVSEHLQVRDRLSQVAQACEGMGDREKAEYFYEWVYDNVDYDRALQSRTIYDAVVNGSAVCWGYVSSYLFLCRMGGLTCEPVYAGNHAWNRTWIDGEWRYCDITWDKCLECSTWRFLTQEEMDLDSMHNHL